jgi:hypothetical protein
MYLPNKYEQIESFILEVITTYGSNAGEREEPGSKAKYQAKIITEGLKQYDVATEFISAVALDHIRVILR